MKITIVIPVFNVRPFLAACLESVRVAVDGLQGAAEAEVICVDDGSTDGSGEILETWAATSQPTANSQQPTTIILRQENYGVSAARNAALAAATGDYVTFVDADDLLAPDALTEAMRLIGRHPQADVVALGLRAFQNGDRPMSDGSAQAAERVCVLVDDLPARLDMTNCFQMYIRRRTLGSVRFPPYAIGEDRVYVYRLARRAQSVVLSDRVGYFYRIHGASAMRTPMTLRKRWDDFRHAVHVLAILLTVRETRWRTRGRYLRLSCVKALALCAGKGVCRWTGK